jgi:hypothetical protein
VCEFAELAIVIDAEVSPLCAVAELDTDPDEGCLGVTDELATDVVTTKETLSLRDAGVACCSLVV